MSAPLEDLYDARYETADQTAHFTYSQGTDRIVDVFVSYYRYEREGAEAVNSLNTPYDYEPEGEGDPAWDRAAGGAVSLSTGDATVNAGAFDLVGPRDRRRFTAQFYWTGGALTGSPGEAKLQGLMARLTGGERAAAVIVLSSPYREDVGRARAAVEAFVAAAPGMTGFFSAGR